MKRIKCIKRIGTIEQAITGLVNDEVFNSNHDLIGYGVEYKTNRNCLCNVRDFDEILLY